jgi:hypothetical protein
VLLALVAIAFAGRELWRRRRGQKPGDPRPRDERMAHDATELYRALERALAQRGVPRPVSTPPLLHAKSLEALGHPVGNEAVELTQKYLRVRFGGEELDASMRREYLDRVRDLKTQES